MAWAGLWKGIWGFYEMQGTLFTDSQVCRFSNPLFSSSGSVPVVPSHIAFLHLADAMTEVTRKHVVKESERSKARSSSRAGVSWHGIWGHGVEHHSIQSIYE